MANIWLVFLFFVVVFILLNGLNNIFFRDPSEGFVAEIDDLYPGDFPWINRFFYFPYLGFPYYGYRDYPYYNLPYYYYQRNSFDRYRKVWGNRLTKHERHNRK